MPQLFEETEFDLREAVEAERQRNAAQRAELTARLPEIADEVSIALRDADIAVSVFFTVPSAGPLMTFATPIDPDDPTWNRVCEIVVPIVSRAVGATDLICREAPCAAAIPMAAADLLADPDAANADY